MPYKKRSKGRFCSVFGCKNSNRKLYHWKEEFCLEHEGIKHGDCTCITPFSFLMFPKDPELRQQWVKKINRKGFQPGRFSVVCSKHFLGGRPTSENSLPVLELGYKTTHFNKEKLDSTMDFILPDYDDFPSQIKKEPLNVEVEPGLTPFEENGDCSSLVNNLPAQIKEEPLDDAPWVDHLPNRVKVEPLDEEVISPDYDFMPMREESRLSDTKSELLSWEEGNSFSSHQSSSESDETTLALSKRGHSLGEFAVVDNLCLNQPGVNISKEIEPHCSICGIAFASIDCLDHNNTLKVKENIVESNKIAHDQGETSATQSKSRSVCDSCEKGELDDHHLFENDFSVIVNAKDLGQSFKKPSPVVNPPRKKTEVEQNTSTVSVIPITPSAHSSKPELTHTKTKVIMCKDCGKVFKTKSNLVKHSSRARDRGPCPLLEHQIDHNRRTCYFCKHCVTIFNQKYSFS